MQDLATIERIAMEKGWHRRLEQDWEEGWKEGWKKGWKEGLQAGFQQSILIVLQARFGVVPTTAAGRLEQVEDLERLQALLQEAVTAESLVAFEELLANDEA